MTYHMSKFCPLSGQFAPNVEQHDHRLVEKLPLEPLTINRFW